jgi:putative N-acetyltransferase (TIGR04045 family)
MNAYSFKLARCDRDLEAYFVLRHQIFVEEQSMFVNSDIDALDEIAYPIVATTIDDRVVGVVRIYEKSPRIWYGGRLGTHRDYRRGWQIGKGLIDKAVTTANTWGCDRFLATVQLQNVRFFQRLHWRSLTEQNICDRIHHLMEADLNYYPPGNEIRPLLRWQKQEVSECCPI